MTTKIFCVTLGEWLTPDTPRGWAKVEEESA